MQRDFQHFLNTMTFVHKSEYIWSWLKFPVDQLDPIIYTLLFSLLCNHFLSFFKHEFSLFLCLYSTVYSLLIFLFAKQKQYKFIFSLYFVLFLPPVHMWNLSFFIHLSSAFYSSFSFLYASNYLIFPPFLKIFFFLLFVFCSYQERYVVIFKL